jgi:hypothetical protein
MKAYGQKEGKYLQVQLNSAAAQSRPTRRQHVGDKPEMITLLALRRKQICPRAPNAVKAQGFLGDIFSSSSFFHLEACGVLERGSS